MNSQELAELMQVTAKDAVWYAEEQHQVVLDFSLDSLTKVDEILRVLFLRHLEKRFTDEELFTLSNLFGAYTGEIFIHHVGGQWYQDKSTPEAPYICVHSADKQFAFASLVYHQIATVPGIGLRNYVAQAMSNAMQ